LRTGNLACPTVDLLPRGKKITVAAVIPLHTPRTGIPRNSGPAWTGIPARLAPELWPGINRNTHTFRSIADSEYVEGICFITSKGEEIANYPKQHAANLTTKHQNTSKLFKPMARVFKNMRTRMISDQLIDAGIAPSYFIEGLLYNMPEGKFASTYQHCVVSLLNWYRQEAAKRNLVCANEQHYLLRDGHHTCWPQSNCDTFVDAAVRLWDEW
jgi:hypothetical protein